jgi:electron transfer flavoprotein beta subunit
VRILVALTRAVDPDNANRVRVSTDSQNIDRSDLEWKTNPFDEYALEAALRLTEAASAPKTRVGDVAIVAVGPADAEAIPLRHGLALGADRAIRVDADESWLDGALVAKVLCALAQREQPDLIMLGKQSVDTESSQVGQRLAELLDWPMATCAAAILEEPEGTLRVAREVDRGVQSVRLTLPAVITVDLRVIAPSSVRSKHTPATFEYPAGVRYAPLPAILKARRKPIDVIALGALLEKPLCSTRCVRFAPAPTRPMGRRVRDVNELVGVLAKEARVL